MDEYAVIQSGNHQYRVSRGDIIDVELIEGSDKALELKEVLYLKKADRMWIGAPFVEGATVHAEVIGQVRGPKIIAYKYKKRKNYMRKVGHRQDYLRIKITQIQAA